METAKPTKTFNFISILILYLDRGRCFVLRRTLNVPFILKIYSDRGKRVFVLSLLSMAISLMVSLIAPYIVIFIGPLIFGFPHLLATYLFLPRFFSKKINQLPLLLGFTGDRHLVGFCLIISAIYKIFFENILTNQIKTFVPLVEIAVTSGAFFWLIKPAIFSRKTILGACEQATFAAMVLIFPFESMTFLILFHNFQAFLFWGIVAKENKHLLYPTLSSVIFIAINAFIGLGFFDHFHNHISHILTPSFFSLPYQVVPTTLNSLYLTRVAIALAFGQGVHYFIWLKAIPDELRVEPVPLTLRKSLGRLLKNSGPIAPIFMTAMMLALIAVACFSPERARTLYLCVASAHGFLELGVGFAIFNRLFISD